MADLSGIDRIRLTLDTEFNSFAIPSRFRFMQELWIQVRISTRDKKTGALRLLKPYPRIWTGYYYLLSENCIFKHGAIEFQNQEIYRQQNLSWNTEVAVNENAFNLSTPEVPPDIDNVDEAAENDLWTGTNDRKNIYLPVQLPIDRISFYIPPLCELEVLISGRKFSPISAFGGDNDIDLYEDADLDGEPDLLIATPPNPDAFPPMDETDIITDFDDIARASGYILSSECEAQNAGDLKEWIDATRADMDRILSALLADSSILQSDIDSIRANNPDISDEDLLKELIDAGVISASELARAIEFALTRTIIPPLGKKAVWAALYETLDSNCVDILYQGQRITMNANGSWTCGSLGTRPTPFTSADMAWNGVSYLPQSAFGVPSYSLQSVISTRCQSQFWVTNLSMSGQPISGGQIVTWVESPPRFVYFIQP